MPHAAPTATAPTDPAVMFPAPSAATKSRGNPNLAPAQLARGLGPRGSEVFRGSRGRPGAVSGCATPGPSMATTVPTRAENRYRLALSRISRVDIALDRYQAHLPPAPCAICPP